MNTKGKEGKFFIRVLDFHKSIQESLLRYWKMINYGRTNFSLNLHSQKKTSLKSQRVTLKISIIFSS